jgi:hypothetical protein
LSEYGHLLPAYRRQAGLPDDERIAWIRADRWLDFEQARGALARLDDLLSYPPRDRMPCLLLYGDTGMGKTKIIRKFLRDHPPTFDKATGVTTMPVVAMQMPAEPIERDIYGELLVSLGVSGPIDGATHRQKELCRSLLRSMGARMLIIDEVHAMLAGSFRQQRIFLNAIRFLANDLKAPLVCAGTAMRRRPRRRGLARRHSGVFQDAVLRPRGVDRGPSLGGVRGAPGRAAALGPASRAGPKQDPLHFARRVRRSLSAAGRGGGGSERALGHGVPGMADADAPRRRATPRSRRREAGLGVRAVHARSAGGMDGRGLPGSPGPFGPPERGRAVPPWTTAAFRGGIPQARGVPFGERGVARREDWPSRRASANAWIAHESCARVARGRIVNVEAHAGVVGRPSVGRVGIHETGRQG